MAEKSLLELCLVDALDDYVWILPEQEELKELAKEENRQIIAKAIKECGVV